MKLKSLKKDLKDDYSDKSFRFRPDLTRSNLVQIIKKDKFIKQSNSPIFIDNKKLL